jgi:hypothetical protein
VRGQPHLGEGCGGRAEGSAWAGGHAPAHGSGGGARGQQRSGASQQLWRGLAAAAPHPPGPAPPLAGKPPPLPHLCAASCPPCTRTSKASGAQGTLKKKLLQAGWRRWAAQTPCALLRMPCSLSLTLGSA